MGLCTGLGGVSEFHTAARYALDSCPPSVLVGLSELFIFTDGSAAPPACPDASARLGWSAVCVGRFGTGYRFLGAVFHGMSGSGGVVQHGPVGDSSTMELAAVLWALVWVVISCPHFAACASPLALYSCLMLLKPSGVLEAMPSLHVFVRQCCSLPDRSLMLALSMLKPMRATLSMNLRMVLPRGQREVLLPRILLMFPACWFIVTV